MNCALSTCESQKPDDKVKSSRCKLKIPLLAGARNSEDILLRENLQRKENNNETRINYCSGGPALFYPVASLDDAPSYETC